MNTKISYFEKIESPQHQSFVLLQNNCVLCGTTLEFRHLANPEDASIKEEAHCPQCELKTRDKVHAVH